MSSEIIVSRQCSVGPNGAFSHGAGQGPVTISINFYRPVPHPEYAPDHQCTYEIKYGDDVVRTSSVVNIDGVSALLSAMRNAVIDIETGCLEKWNISIPKEYLEDMRTAGATPP
jgi:hypothetical protein